jgi:hypothetical protein
LVFFDGILIYNSAWSEHLQYMSLMLSARQEHQLFMKHAKCAFGCTEVSYLGHVILAIDVGMDQHKV